MALISSNFDVVPMEVSATAVLHLLGVAIKQKFLLNCRKTMEAGLGLCR